LNGFRFVKINNLFDFTYGNGDIMKLSVTFTFDNMEMVKDEQDVVKLRKLKIQKLLDTSVKKIYDSKIFI
jgi:hypothetical protein